MFKEHNNTVNKSDIIKPDIIKRDFKNIREDRQKNNNDLVYHAIISNNTKEFHKNINKKALERKMKETKKTKEELLQKCREDDEYCVLLSSCISIISSRQGTKDEKLQLETCNLTAVKCGIEVTPLSPTDFRPTKDGYIISKKEMEEEKIDIDSCLKSFDGKISGIVNGYIAAKIVYGTGGHQYNVFEEMHTIGHWWEKYKSDTLEVLVILIDTDQKIKLDRLKEKYNNVNNIFVYNHIEFQQYMIDRYYKEASI